MGNLRTEQKELKTMFKTLKSTNKKRFITDQLKNAMETKGLLHKPNTDTNHRFILKKPARLLPLYLFQK